MKTLRGMFALLLILAALSGAAQAQTSAAPPLQVTDTNDVMDGKLPKLPTFPKLAKKPGYLRGYVKDASGKPLKGAYVMIYPSAMFGYGMTKRSISVRTDEAGYYEVKIPSGGCVVWCAGYALDYHGVRLALPLHPADGELDPLSMDKGDIENFILATYGVASPSSASENPVYAHAYYGASFTIGYGTREADDQNAPKNWLVLGSEVEITLVPDGPLVDGTPGRPLVIRKKITPGTYFQVNDVPIGCYKISARMIENGKATLLHLKDNSWKGRKGGMTPTETDDTGTIVFRSEGGDPSILRVPGGGMERISLVVDRKP